MSAHEMNAKDLAERAQKCLHKVIAESPEEWLELAKTQAAIAQVYATLAQAEAIAMRDEDRH